MTVSRSGLRTRHEYEQLALIEGWSVDKTVAERTAFGRDGWLIRVTWLSEYPTALAVFDPNLLTVLQMNFLVDRWEIGPELAAQLKSPGPQQEPRESLPTLIAGYARLLEMQDVDCMLRAHAVAQRLRDILEGAAP